MMKILKFLVLLIVLFNIHNLYGYRLLDLDKQKTTTLSGITREIIELRTNKPGLLKLSSSVDSDVIYLMKVQGVYDRKKIRFISKYNLSYYPEKLLGLKKGNKKIKIKRIETASVKKSDEKGMLISFIKEKLDKNHSYLLYTNLSRSKKTESLTFTYTPVSQKSKNDKSEKLKENDIKQFRFIEGRTLKEYDFRISKDGYLQFTLGNVPSSIEQMYFKLYRDGEKKVFFQKGMDCKNGEGKFSKLISSGNYTLKITPNYGDEYIDIGKNTSDEMFLLTEFREFEDQDKYEPNDSIKSAVPIKFGEFNQISIFPYNDKDYFVFTLDKKDTCIDIFFSKIPQKVYLHYTVMDSSGTKIHEAKLEKINSFTIGTPGKYYIEFKDMPRKNWDKKDSDSQVFRFMLNRRRLIDANEINNSQKTATVLRGLSGNISGTFEKHDSDYFKLDMKDGYYTVSLHFTDVGTYTRFEFYKNNELLKQSDFRNTLNFQRAIYSVEKDVFWFRLIPQNSEFQHSSYNLTYSIIPADGNSAFLPCSGQELKEESWISGTVGHRWDRDFYSFVPSKSGGYYIYSNNNHNLNIKMDVFTGNKFLMQGSNDSYWNYGPTMLFRDLKSKDFTLDFKIFPRDNDGLGIIFRRQDSKNFYSFRMDLQEKKLEFLIMENGKERKGKVFKDLLYIQNFWNKCSLKVKGESFELMLNGKKVSVSDSTFNKKGSLGMFAASSENLGFDDISLKSESGSIKVDFEDEKDFGIFQFIDKGWWDIKVGGIYSLFQDNNDGKGRVGPIALLKDISTSDFSLSFLCKTFDDDGLGVVFRYKDEKNYYAYRFDNQSRRLELLAVKNGTEKVLKEFKGVLYNGRIWNVMRLEVKGTDFSMYCNDKKVGEFSDSTFSESGRIGFLCSYCDDTFFTKIDLNYSGINLNIDFKNKQDLEKFDLVNGGRWYVKYDDKYFNSDYKTAAHLVNLEKGIKYDLSFRFEQADVLQNLKYDFIIFPADRSTEDPLEVSISDLKNDQIYSAKNSELFLKYKFDSPGSYRILVDKTEWGLKIPGIRLFKAADMDYPKKNILFLSGGDKAYDWTLRYPEFNYKRINAGTSEEKSYLNLDFANFDLVIIDGINNLKQFGLNDRKTYDRLRQKIRSGAKIWLFIRDVAVSKILGIKLKNTWQDNQIIKKDFSDPLMNRIYGDDKGRWHRYENTGYFLDWKEKGYKPLYIPSNDANGAITLKKEIGSGFFLLDTRLLSHSGTYSDDRMIYNILGVKEKFIDVRRLAPNSKTRFFWNDIKIDESGEYYLNFYGLSEKHRICIEISDNRNLRTPTLPGFKKIVMSGNEEAVTLSKNCKKGDKIIVYSTDPILRKNFIQLESVSSTSKKLRTLVLWGEDRYQRKIIEFNDLNADFIDFSDCREHYWWKKIKDYDLVLAIGINRKWQFGLGKKEVQDKIRSYTSRGGKFVLCVTYNREKLEFDGCMFDSEHSQDRIMVKCNPYDSFFDGEKIGLNNWKSSRNNGWLTKVSSSYRTVIMNNGGKPLLVEKKNGKGSIILTSINFLSDGNKFNDVYPFASKLFGLDRKYRHYLSSKSCGIHEFQIPDNFNQLNFHIKSKIPCVFYYKYIQNSNTNEQKSYKKIEADFDVAQDIPIKNYAGLRIEVPCKSSFEYCFKNVSKKPVYMDLFECNPSGFRKTKLKVLYLKGTDGYQTNSHNNLEANPAIDIKKMNWGDCGKEFFQKELSRYEVVIMEGVSGEWEFFNGDSIVKKGIEKFVFGGGTFIFSSPMNCKGKTLLWGTISKKFDRQHNSLKFTKKGESYLDTFYTDNSISWNNSENYSIFSKLPADFTPLIVQKKDSNGVALAVKKIGKGKIYMSTMLFGDSYNFKKLKAVNLLFGLIGNSIPRRISSHKRVDLSEKLSNTDLNSGKYYICFSGNTNNTILWYKLHDKSAGKNYFDFDKKNPEKNRMYFDKWRQIEIHDNSKLSFYFHAKEDTLIESILFSKNKSFYYDMSLIDLKKDIELIKKKSKIVNESEIISVKKGQKIQLVFKIPSINGKTVVSPYFRKKTSFFEPGMYLSSIENPLLLQSDKLFTSVNNDKDILFSLDNVKTDLGFYFFSTFGKLSSDLFIYTVPDDMKDLIKSGSRFPAGVSQAKEAIKTTPVRDPKKFDKNNFIQVYSNCSLTKDFYPSISKEKTGKIVYQYTPNNNMKGKKGESIVHIAMNGFVKKYKGEFVFGDNYWSKNELKYDSAGKNLKLGIRFVKDGKDIKKHVMNLKDGVYKFDIDVTGCKWFDIVFTKLVDEKIVVFSRNMSVEYENGFNFSNGTFKFGRFSGKTDLVPHISGDGTTDISCIKWPSVIECKNDGIKMNLQTLPSRGRKVSLVSRPFELKENWQFELVIDRKINFKIDSFFTIGIKSNSGESRLLVKPETYSVYGSSAVRLMPNDKLDSFVKDKSRLKLKVNYNHRNKYLVFYIDDIPVSYSPQDCSEKWNLFFGMKQNGFWGKKEDKTAGHYRISGMKLCKVRFCDILSHVSKPGYYTHKGIGKIKKGKTYLQVITKNRKLFSLFPEFELKSTGKKTQFKFKPEVEKDLSVIGNIDVLSTSVFDAEKLTVKCGEKKCVVKAVSYYNGYAVRIIPLKNFDSDANVELFYEKRLIKKYRTVLEKVDRLRFKIEMKDMYIGKNDFISILSNSALKKFNIWYSPACIKSFKPITEIEKIDDRTYRISPTFLKEGEYYLKVGGENVFGQSVSQIYKGNSFTVDNTPPARPEIRLESGESGKIDISLDYNDSDVKSVDIFRYEKFHNSSDKKYFVRSLGVNPDNIYTDTPPVLDKDYWYGIIITDLAGNRSKLSEIKKVYSDNTPPAGGKISNVILTSFGKGLIKFRIESQAPENEKKIRYALFDMLRGKKKLLGIFDKKEFEINDLDDGIHAFSVCFSDVAGNISKKNGFDVKGTVDSRGPEFTITSIPKSPFTYGDVKFTFKSNEVLKDDEILVRFVPAAGQSIYLTMKKVDKKTFTSSLKIDDRFRDGRGYFDLTASDIYGNDKLEIKEGRDINIDKTGPVSRIYIKNSKEYYGVTYLNSAEFEFDVIINEKLKAVPKVSFYDKSGKKALDVKLSEIKGYYSMTRFKGNLKLSPEILPEGDYSLRFKGFDVLNNSGDKVSTITKLKVDYTAPAFPNKGTAIFRRKSFIDLKYAVSISPDVRYYLVSRYLSGGDHTKSKPVKLWSDWYRDHDLKKVKDKKVFYRVRSVDRAGNVSEFSKPIETITDFTPPVSPKNLKITKLNDTLKIQFQQPGNEKPFFYNLYYLSVSGDSGSKSFDQIKKGSKLKLSSRDFVFTKKIEGKIWFAVTALDKALNESKPSNIEMIEFDNKPPELKIIPLTLKKGYSLNPRKYSWQTSDKIKLDFNISEKLKSLKATMTSLSSGNVVEMGWDGNSAVSASGLNDGVYVFKISCEDLSENKYSGNCGLYPENIFADTKPPGPFNSIVAKSLPGGKVSFLINHDELSRWDFGIRVEREKSKVFEGKIKVLRSGDGYFEDLPSEDGEFKYTFYAFDGVGNLSKPFELENVISDRSPPVEPTSLTALKKAGIVKIEWKCNEKRKHTFDVYRYGFEVSELTGIEPLDKNIYSNIFKDLPDIDGEYYYYVVSIDETGNRSKLSKPVKVTFKSEIPVATIQLYPAPPLNTDARITLKSSQPLAEIPELKAYFPDGRVEILRLSGNLDTFHSSLKIKKGLKAGTLKFEFKGLGKSGYTGRVINKNEEVEIDFRGPKFDIELSKKQPFTPGKDMDLTLNTSEKLKENPVLIFYEMGGRKENIVLSRESDTVYSGSLHISDKAGEGASFFKIQGIDMAGNTGTRINKNSRVYVDLTPPKQVEKVRCEMKKSGMGLIYFSPSRFENETLDHFNLYIKKLEDKKFFPVGKTFSSPFRYTFNSETVYQIAVTSVDRAGLESEYSRMISIRVDLTPPIAPELISIKVGSEGVFAEGKLKYRGEDDLKEVFVKRGGEKDTITEKIVCKSTGDDTYSFIDVPPKSGKYSYTPYSLNMSSYESTPGSSFSLDYKSLLPECSLRTFPSGKCGVGKIKIMLKVKGELSEEPDIIFVPPGFDPEQAKSILYNIKNIQDAKKYVSKDLTDRGFRIKLKKRGSKFFGELMIEESFGSGRGEFFIVAKTVINGKSIPVTRLAAGNYLTLDLTRPRLRVLIEGDKAGKVQNRYMLKKGKYIFNIVSDKNIEDLSNAYFLTPIGQRMDVTLKKEDSRHFKGEFIVDKNTVNGNYLLKIDAMDSAENKGKIKSGNIFTVDTVRPGLIRGIRLQKMPGQRIRIHWSPPRDKNNNIFEIYRSRKKDSPIDKMMPIRKLKWTIITFDDPPETGKWWYAIRNLDEAGNIGPLSHWIYVDVDLTPPSPPEKLKVSNHSEGVLKLEWKAPMYEEIAFYNVYIANKPIVKTSAAKSMNSGVTWTEIYGAPNEDGKYFFAITSVDKSLNESGPSENVQIDYNAIEPYVEYIRILKSNHWLTVGEYDIELKMNQPLRDIPSLWFTPLDGKEIEVTLNGDKDTYFGKLKITDDLNDKAAYFRFLGFDKQGNKGTKIISGEYFIIDKKAPPPPRNLKIAKDLKTTRGAVELHWNTPYGEVPRCYKIWRDTKPFSIESEAEQIGELKVIYENEDNYFYRDIPPVDGEYFYRVTAYDLAGNVSPMSNQLKLYSRIDIPCFDLTISKKDEKGAKIPVFSIPGGKSFIRLECNKSLKSSPDVRFKIEDVNHLMIREKIVTRDEILASVPPHMLQAMQDLADPNKKKEIIKNVSEKNFDKLMEWKEKLDNSKKRKVVEKGRIIDWTKIYKDPGIVKLRFIKRDDEGKIWESLLRVPEKWVNGEANFSIEATTVDGEQAEFIRKGKKFMIDTMGPKIEIRSPDVEHMDVNLNLKTEQKLVTAPLKTGWHDLNITSTETLGEVPELSYIDSTGITREIHVTGYDRNWKGRINIPLEVGQGKAKFHYKGIDLWGNVSNEVLEKRYWQDIDDTVDPPQVTANYASLGKKFNVDSLAPGIPEDLNVGVIKLGVVKLEWKHPDKNGETPAYYNVYRNYVIFTEKKKSLIVKKKNIAPVAIDAPDRDGNYFYRVSAMDLAGNEGELSELKSIFVDSIKPELKIKAVPSGDWLVIEVESKTDLPELSLTLNFPGSTKKTAILGGDSGKLKRKVTPSGSIVYTFVIPEKREVFNGHVNIVVHSPDPVGNQIKEEIELESKWISEDTGGEIESADDMASFVIPPGVKPFIPKGKKKIEVSGREHIFYVTYANIPKKESREKPEYDRIRPAPMPPQLSVVGKPYTIHINIPPEKPVSMKASFSQMEIPKLPKLTMKIPQIMQDQYSDPEFMKRKLKVIMWNPPDKEKKGVWSVVANVELDPINNRIIIPAEKITSYALVTEKTPPSVREMYPVPGIAIKNFQPKISFLIVDKGTGVAVGAENLIAVHIDGIPVSGSNIITSKNNPTEVRVKVKLDKPLLPGKHYISVRCEDVVENIAKVEWDFIIDNEKPEISLLYPNEDEIAAVSDSVRAYFKISDIGGGVKRDGITLKVNHRRLPGKYYTYGQFAEDKESGLLTVFPGREYIKDGNNIFMVLAKDIAGMKQLKKYILKYDSTKPQISLSKMRFFDGLMICRNGIVNIGITDNVLLNKAGILVILNGIKISSFDYDPLKGTVSVGDLTEGYNTIAVRVFDKAGNSDYVNHSILYIPESSIITSKYGEKETTVHIVEFPTYIPESWYYKRFFKLDVSGKTLIRPIFKPDFSLLHFKGDRDLKLKIAY